MLSKKELLKQPRRPYSTTNTEYESILIVPTGNKHSSGFMSIAIIGVAHNPDGTEKYEICGEPDDISTVFPQNQFTHDNLMLTISTVRMDCYYPSGVLRYHGTGTFKVSEPLSSQAIIFTPYKRYEKTQD